MTSTDRLAAPDYGRRIADRLADLCNADKRFGETPVVRRFLDDQFPPEMIGAAARAGAKFGLRPEIAACFIFMVRLRMWAAKTSFWSRLRSKPMRDINLVYNTVGPAVSKLCEEYIAAHPAATNDFLSALLDELPAPPAPSR